MSKDNVINEPMKELIVTMSAWGRLKINAERMRRSDDPGKSSAGLFILTVMYEAWTDAQKDLKDAEKGLKKTMKEEVKE